MREIEELPRAAPVVLGVGDQGDRDEGRPEIDGADVDLSCSRRLVAPDRRWPSRSTLFQPFSSVGLKSTTPKPARTWIAYSWLTSGRWMILYSSPSPPFASDTTRYGCGR